MPAIEHTALAAEMATLAKESSDRFDRIRDLEAALREIRDFRDATNEWDGVDVCMPAMRDIARGALGCEQETKGDDSGN